MLISVDDTVPVYIERGVTSGHAVSLLERSENIKYNQIKVFFFLFCNFGLFLFSVYVAMGRG